MSGTEATKLKGFVHRLPRTERLVLILYYAEKLTTREISLVLDVSEQRVMQILGALQTQARSVLVSIVRGHKRAVAAHN
jgi:DNA-directed RNA polymerase specialized sigma subunit